MAGRLGGSLDVMDSTSLGIQPTTALTHAVLQSFSACIEGPDYTMRDAWDGSIPTRSMWGSSHDPSDVGTVREGECESENEGTVQGGSDAGTVRGQDAAQDEEGDQAIVPEESTEVLEAPEEHADQDEADQVSHIEASSPVNTPAPLVLVAKWSPIRFGRVLPSADGRGDEETSSNRLPPSIEGTTRKVEEEDEEEREPSATPPPRKLFFMFPVLRVLTINHLDDDVSPSPRTAETRAHPATVPSPPRDSSLNEEASDTTTESPEPARKRRRIS
jgi:hypothetical protein